MKNQRVGGTGGGPDSRPHSVHHKAKRIVPDEKDLKRKMIKIFRNFVSLLKLTVQEDDRTVQGGGAYKRPQIIMLHQKKVGLESDP